jgi:hypothetical protein
MAIELTALSIDADDVRRPEFLPGQTIWIRQKRAVRQLDRDVAVDAIVIALAVQGPCEGRQLLLRRELRKQVRRRHKIFEVRDVRKITDDAEIRRQRHSAFPFSAALKAEA